jgi:hypothetical protein
VHRDPALTREAAGRKASKHLPGPESEARDNASIITAHVDGLDQGGYLVGWAWLPDHPGRRVAVSAYVGEELVTFGTANVLRDDVRAAGFGDGLYGFSLPLTERILTPGTRTFSVQFEATGAKGRTIEVDLEALATPEHPKRTTAPASNVSPAAIPQLEPSAGVVTPTAIYVPGQYIVCGTPHPRPPYHAHGWCEPEKDFTWIDGVEATIEMLVRRPSDTYTMEIDVVPNAIGSKLQTLEIFFNFFRVGFFEVQRPTTISLDLPSQVFTLRKTRIHLHCREAANSSENGGEGDDRRLGIAVAGWCIT